MNGGCREGAASKRPRPRLQCANDPSVLPPSPPSSSRTLLQQRRRPPCRPKKACPSECSIEEARAEGGGPATPQLRERAQVQAQALVQLRQRMLALVLVRERRREQAMLRPLSRRNFLRTTSWASSARRRRPFCRAETRRQLRRRKGREEKSHLEKYLPLRASNPPATAATDGEARRDRMSPSRGCERRVPRTAGSSSGSGSGSGEGLLDLTRLLM